MKEPGPGLPDGCGFWLGTAGFVSALGAIGITIAVAEYHPPWTSALFIAGSVMCALGCVAAIWALLLYLTTVFRARKILKTADAVSRGELARWLRSVLREINGDLRQAAAGIEQACRDRSYWGVRHEFDLGQTWEDNRQRLAALEGRGDLYDVLRDAYAGITRVRRVASQSSMTPAEAQDLSSVRDAIRKAEVAVAKELAELG
jgi:hypothetical protein